MNLFPGQHANEKVLALIEQSGIFWLKLALRWWWALTFLFGLCAFFVDLIWAGHRLSIIALFVIVEFAALLLLVVWHLRQRAKRKIYITNERIVRFNGKEQISMNLEEIRDIQARKYHKFTNIGDLIFTGVTPLKAKRIPEVRALAKYVNELLRLKKAGSEVFPRYRN